jgi:hypothetical protein
MPNVDGVRQVTAEQLKMMAHEFLNEIMGKPLYGDDAAKVFSDVWLQYGVPGNKKSIIAISMLIGAAYMLATSSEDVSS